MPYSSQVICMPEFSSCIDIVTQNLIIGMSQIKILKVKQDCAAAGAAGHQHRSEACTVCGRSGNMSDKTGNVCIM